MYNTNIFGEIYEADSWLELNAWILLYTQTF